MRDLGFDDDFIVRIQNAGISIPDDASEGSIREAVEFREK